MKNVLLRLRNFLRPPLWVQILLPPPVFAALIWVLLCGQSESVPAYILYAVSMYCLVILVLPLPGAFMKAKRAFMRRWTSTAFGKKYTESLAFRGNISLYQGMAVNFFYVLFRAFTGIRYASVWFIFMAVYYLVLGVLRLYLILSYRRRTPGSEQRCYRKTAWMLFLLNIPMGGMIVLMVQTDSGFSYPGYVIYVSALYTFYVMTTAVLNLIKYRRLGSPILSAAKVLNFVSGMMSLLGLQTAMISAFSVNGESYRKMMNTITGGAVYGIVILLAVYMLLHSRKLQKGRECVEPVGK